MKVSAFILSFNHTVKLIECVQSLLQQSCIDEILVLENFSTVKMEDTYKTIQQLSPIVQVTIASHPMSFSEGQNWGLDHAKNNFVLLMNNDARFIAPDSLQSSVSILDNTPSIGLVGHKIYNLDGSLNHFGVDFNSLGDLDHFGRGDNGKNPEYSTIIECAAVTAACVLVRKTHLRFDTHYWFEFEDVDFCFQYLKADYRIVCNPACEVSHEESSSRGEIQKVNYEWIGKQSVGHRYFKKKWKSFYPVIRKKTLIFSLLKVKKFRFFRQHPTDLIFIMLCTALLAYFDFFWPLLLGLAIAAIIRYLVVILGYFCALIYLKLKKGIFGL
jgi:GT2 family glycosyltransferase